ncbi:MAG: hypothetical protein C5B47_04480 [Verrucomicrobia bacterium]|nr:MAG: hypothetical protein C5B47_04480 [Verrucomicrobiota bacterium]
MKASHYSITVPTQGKGTYEITQKVEEMVSQSGVQTGIATIFIRHTSASLMIYENADFTARKDLHSYFERLVPEDDPGLIHVSEGPDDSTSHLRGALTRTGESIPIVEGKLALGTWQGIFIFEHRRAAHQRTVDVAVLGI